MCSKEKLEKFSLEHYTYINQIFGDQTVRKIISEAYPNNKYEFKVVKDDVMDSDHHMLKGKNKIPDWCSTETAKIQNIDVNKNDTLCQSYSLLEYLGFTIPEDRIELQRMMTKMYRECILNHPFIVKEIRDLLSNKDNRKLWIDNTKPNKPYIQISKKSRYAVIQKIKKVLNDWDKFGYNYFIGNGEC